MEQRRDFHHIIFLRSVGARTGISLFFALVLPVITIMIHMNPSHAGPKSPFDGWGEALLPTVVFFFAGFSIFFLILSVKRRGAFLFVFFSMFSLLCAITILGALVLHRDYFTYIFQLVIMFWLILCSRNSFFRTSHPKKEFFTFLFVFNSAICGLWTIWTMMMGYAISTRQEPRWAESIVYNLFNLLLIIFLGTVSVLLNRRRYRNITIYEGDIYIDDWNFSGFFGDIDKKIALRLITTHKELTCSELSSYWQKTSDETGGNSNRWDCGECMSKSYTASKCPAYKKVYNRILTIKKLLESLEIGTVITPDNKMQIKDIGWKLRLFDDVRIIHYGRENKHSVEENNEAVVVQLH